MTLKSILLGLASAALLAQAAAGHARTLDDVRADKTLSVVTTASAPPHGFKNPQSNRLEGIMVDVAAAVARHLGVADKLSDVPFSGLIPTLTSGRADVMSAPLFITENARAPSISRRRSMNGAKASWSATRRPGATASSRTCAASASACWSIPCSST